MREEKLQDLRNEAFITVDELATIMRISRSMAYKYVKSRECPFNRQQIGTRILIPTKTFFQWYDSLENE
jgi:excisionase family DNA binding protein